MTQSIEERCTRYLLNFFFACIWDINWGTIVENGTIVEDCTNVENGYLNK